MEKQNRPETSKIFHTDNCTIRKNETIQTIESVIERNRFSRWTNLVRLVTATKRNSSKRLEKGNYYFGRD